MNSGIPEQRGLQTIMALFEQVTALAAEQRPAFVDQLAQDDPELAAELTSLLRAFEQTGDFLEPASIRRLATDMLDDEQTSSVGQQIGAYRLVRELGHGGMGVVYIAERSDGEFDHRVALKLVKRGMDTDEILSRFRNERQILAQLDHPNIAVLLDGGATEQGDPYFAMEYVEGLPLLQYCDKSGLSLNERLRLFLMVCRAVQFAHSNLVIHRDIKSSNILVTPDGHPKLLDFGIAKLLGPNDGLEKIATRIEQRALTPESASPEQRSSLAVTTASDIYQLGLLLYRMLTGVSPFAKRKSQSLTGDGTDVEPTVVKPSVAVTTAPNSTRNPAPSRRARPLRGDLDNIILMAMRTEPARRYASVAQFAADIERHLDDLPVIARRDSAGYHARKFLQRHLLGVASAALVLLALLAGIAGTSWQARVAANQAARAEQIKDFTLDLLSISDPDANRGEVVSVNDLLNAGLPRIEAELADQPDLQAEMLLVIGSLQRKLGEFDAATISLERSLALRQTLFSAASLPVAQNLYELGALHYATGDFMAAQTRLNESLHIRRQLAGDEDPAVAEVLVALGPVLRNLGELAQAKSYVEQSLVIRRAVNTPDDPGVADALSELGVIARRRDDNAGARRYHEEALAIRRAAYGNAHSTVASSLMNLALTFHSEGKLNQAEPLYREALEIKRSVFGPDHPEMSSALNSLASLLHLDGQYESSRAMFEEALRVQRAALGENNSQVARTLTNYGGLLIELGESNTGVQVLQHALTINRATLGNDHPSTATSMNNLGKLLGNIGRSDEAMLLSAEAAETYRRKLGDDHRFYAIALLNLVSSEIDSGELASAEQHALTAHAILKDLPADASVTGAVGRLRLAEVYLAQKRATQAKPLLLDALERFNNARANHAMIPEVRNVLGAVLSLQNDPAASELLLTSATELAGHNYRLRRRSLIRLIEHFERGADADRAAQHRRQLDALDANL